MTDYKKQISVANTEDFNDMRNMLSEIEISLVGTDPVEQTRTYRGLQEAIYELREQCVPSEEMC